MMLYYTLLRGKTNFLDSILDKGNTNIELHECLASPCRDIIKGNSN